MIHGNTSDFIDHPLPIHFVSVHGASHHAWAPGPPPSKSGAAAHVKGNTIFRTQLLRLHMNEKSCTKVKTIHMEAKWFQPRTPSCHKDK